LGIDYTLTNDVVRVSGPTLPGATYTLETTSPTLPNSPSWARDEAAHGTGATPAFEEILPVSPKCQRFYRVRKD